MFGWTTVIIIAVANMVAIPAASGLGCVGVMLGTGLGLCLACVLSPFLALLALHRQQHALIACLACGIVPLAVIMNIAMPDMERALAAGLVCTGAVLLIAWGICPDLIIDRTRCVLCGYDLRGHRHERCPECGKPVQRDDPTQPSRSAERARLAGRAVPAVLGAVLYVCGVGLALHDSLVNTDAVLWRQLRSNEILVREVGREKLARRGLTALMAAATHEDWKIRREALAAVQSLRPQDSESVVRLLLHDAVPAVRRRAMVTAARLRLTGVFDDLVGLTHGEDVEATRIALRSIAELDGERAVPVLCEMLSDEKPEVRLRAMMALAYVSGQDVVWLERPVDLAELQQWWEGEGREVYGGNWPESE